MWILDFVGVQEGTIWNQMIDMIRDTILKEKSVAMKVTLERCVWKIGDNDIEFETSFECCKEMWNHSNTFDNKLTTRDILMRRIDGQNYLAG